MHITQEINKSHICVTFGRSLLKTYTNSVVSKLCFLGSQKYVKPKLGEVEQWNEPYCQISLMYNAFTLALKQHGQLVLSENQAKNNFMHAAYLTVIH